MSWGGRDEGSVMGGVRDVPWSTVSQGREGWVQKEEGKGKNEMAQRKPGKSAQRLTGV